MSETITILSIDDDREICSTLSLLFQYQGWLPISAYNVRDGLEQFKIHRPDMVLIDYHMPGANGVEGVRRLRQLSTTVPIIVFTINEDQNIADAFLEAGANDFAIKPIRAPDLISRINLHLRLLKQAKKQESTLPKGMSACTLELIQNCLNHAQKPMTAQDIASNTGLSHQTAYRYLQYMLRADMLKMEFIYGKMGRPRQFFLPYGSNAPDSMTH